jgi:hypothetical protein
MEDQDKSENISGARIMMTGGVGPTKQSNQRSFPRFSSVSLTPPIDKLIRVVRLRKAEVGAFRPASIAIEASHHRPRSRSDFDVVPDPSESSGIAQSQGRFAKIVDGTICEGAAQHVDLQRRSFVPRRPS